MDGSVRTEAKVNVEDGAVDTFANLPEEGDRDDSRKRTTSGT